MSALFDMVLSGRVKAPVQARYRLEDVAEAYRELEARATIGATVVELENHVPNCSKVLDRVLVVSDDDIRTAQACLWDAARLVVEPGGATAFAAVLTRPCQPLADERVGVVLSGGNVDPR